MGKYGIGARVRDEGGDEGVIIDKRKGERLVKYEAFDCWKAKSGLEAIDPFKVGDRVRIVADNGGFGEIGDVGEVVQCNAGDEDCMVRFDREINGDREWFVTWESLELVTSEPALTLRAGGYYKLRNGETVGPLVVFDGQGLSRATINGIQDAAFYIDCKGSYAADGLWLTSNGNDRNDIVEEVPAPAAATPTLTIEAGKFYRTRDGRKVGPITRGGPGAFEFWVAPRLEGSAWRQAWFEDGSFWPVGSPHRNTSNAERDLVAEWVEPAVEAPQPKFKKGDRVIFTETSSYSFTEGRIYVCRADSYRNGQYAERVSVEANDAGEEDGWLAEYFAPAPTDFQVGDVVRQTDADPGKSSIWDNSVVERIDGVLFPVSARNPKGRVGAFAVDQIELVRRPPAPVVGATVTGTVVANDNGKSTVKFGDGTSAYQVEVPSSSLVA
jgi:hypothetical protein